MARKNETYANAPGFYAVATTRRFVRWTTGGAVRRFAIVTERFDGSGNSWRWVEVDRKVGILRMAAVEYRSLVDATKGVRAQLRKERASHAAVGLRKCPIVGTAGEQVRELERQVTLPLVTLIGDKVCLSGSHLGRRPELQPKWLGRVGVVTGYAVYPGSVKVRWGVNAPETIEDASILQIA